MALYTVKEMSKDFYQDVMEITYLAQMTDSEKEIIVAAAKEVLSETKNNLKLALKARLEEEIKEKVYIAIYPCKGGFLMTVLCANQHIRGMLLEASCPQPLSLKAISLSAVFGHMERKEQVETLQIAKTLKEELMARFQREIRQ